MLTSLSPNLDSTFCSPVARTSSSSSSAGESQDLCFQQPSEPWLGLGGLKECLEELELFWRTEDCQQKDPAKDRSAVHPKKTGVMENQVDPDQDFKVITENIELLKKCNYYYGSLSWIDAAHLLKHTKVGTFLVRDSEHHSYLYALSVQTRRGPTSCRIEYLNGRFKLDSSEELADKMPRFSNITDLIDHYVQLTKNLPRKISGKELSPVWLDMDEENSLDVPVQIYKPLYKNVLTLSHMCRLALMRMRRDPSLPYRTTNDFERILPTHIVKYLKQYEYPQ